MKKLGKVVLGLATLSMLAACQKEVTREEAVKTVEGYDTSVKYKSGVRKSSVKATADGSIATALKDAFLLVLKGSGIEDGKEVKIDNPETYRLSIAALPAASEVNKYKLDGNQLTIDFKYAYEGLSGTASSAYDDKGYSTVSTINLASSDASLKVTIDVQISFTWTK